MTFTGKTELTSLSRLHTIFRRARGPVPAPVLMVISRFGVIAANLVTGVFIARAMPLDVRGAFATAIALPGLAAMLLTAGLDSATLRLSGRDDQRTIAIRTSLRRALWSALIPVVFTALTFLNVLPTQLPGNRLDWVVGSLAIPLLVGNQLVANCAIGARETRVWIYASFANAVVYLVSAATAFALGAASVIAFLTCFIAANLVTAAVLAWWVAHLRLIDVPRCEEAVRAMTSTARGTAVPTVAQLAMLRVPVPLLTVFAGAGQVGVLAVALPFAESLLILPVMAASYLLPRYYDDRSPSRPVRRDAAVVLGLTASLALVIGLAVPLIIPRVYGHQYEDAALSVQILLPGVVLFSYARTLQSGLFAVGRYTAVTVGSVTGLASSVVVQAMLSSRMGAEGGALSISVGYTVATLSIVLGHRIATSRATI